VHVSHNPWTMGFSIHLQGWHSAPLRGGTGASRRGIVLLLVVTIGNRKGCPACSKPSPLTTCCPEVAHNGEMTARRTKALSEKTNRSTRQIPGTLVRHLELYAASDLYVGPSLHDSFALPPPRSHGLRAARYYFLSKCAPRSSARIDGLSFRTRLILTTGRFIKCSTSIKICGSSRRQCGEDGPPVHVGQNAAELGVLSSRFSSGRPAKTYSRRKRCDEDAAPCSAPKQAQIVNKEK